jgi:hypothetical protein
VRDAAEAAGLLDVHPVGEDPHDQVGREPQETIPRPALAAFDTLQQEDRPLALVEPAEERYRCQGVGDDLGAHRHHAIRFGEPQVLAFFREAIKNHKPS